MFCANCGTKQNDGEKFCPNCGTKFEESLVTKEVVKQEEKVASVNEDKLQNEIDETKSDVIASVIENISNSKQSVKVEETKKNDVETVVQVKAKTKEQKTDFVELTEQKVNITSIVNEVKDTTNPIADNISSNSININDDLSESIVTTQGVTKQSDYVIEDDGSKEALIRLAIKYEFGLGINVDMAMANKYYSKAGIEENDYEAMIIDIDSKTISGITSDKYEVNSTLIFDKEEYFKEIETKKIQELKREKEKLKSESYCRINDKQNIIEFKYVVKRIPSDLLNLIDSYNQRVTKYGLNPIVVNEAKLLIEGKYQELKDMSNLSFYNACSYGWYQDEIKERFKEILQNCNSIRDI